MRKIIFSILFIISSFSVWAGLKPEEYSLIINLAGRQRMLTQKMVKEALLIYAGIDTEKNRADLKETVGVFKKTLNGLRNGDRSLGLPEPYSGAIKAQLDVVDILFKEMEPILNRIMAGEPPTLDAVVFLSERDPLLLENMNIVVEMYEQESRNIITGEIAFLGIEINLSGKQRMLSQKMAKEYVLVCLDINKKNNKRMLLSTYWLFDKSLMGLKFGDGDLDLPATKDENISQKIDNVIEIWNRLRPLIGKACDVMAEEIPREDLKTVAQLNTALLEELDRTVKMYEASAGKR